MSRAKIIHVSCHALMSILVIARFSRCEGSGDYTLPTDNLTAYYNWPFVLDCYEVAEQCLLNNRYECTVISKDSNDTIHFQNSTNSTSSRYYEINNTTIESPDGFEYIIQNDDRSCSQAVDLEKMFLPNSTCMEFSQQTTSLVSEIEEGFSISRRCFIPFKESQVLGDLSKYSLTWYHNCQTNMPANVSEGVMDNIAIANPNHSLHPGNYSCSIAHSGETRYLVQYTICMKPKRPRTQVNIRCSTDNIRYKVGNTATIECNVDVATSPTTDKEFNMNFYPLRADMTKDESRDNMSCTAPLLKSPATLDDRANCSFTSDRTIEQICFAVIPSEEEWEREKNKPSQILRMTYTLKNLQPEDFGFFQAFVRYNVDNNNDTAVVEIVLDKEEQKRAALIGGVLAGTVVVLVVIGCVLYFNRLRVRLLWRRSTFVSYESKLCLYGAYFTYMWSNDKPSDTTANVRYSDLISGIREFVEKIGFEIYDPAEQPADCHWPIQNAKEIQQRCDRVIIILTKAFLEQSTVEPDLYESFFDKKFILIETPDFEAAYKALDQERRNGIDAHFQRNYTIKWSGRGGELSSRFKMELELAMPKIRTKRQYEFEDVDLSYL